MRASGFFEGVRQTEMKLGEFDFAVPLFYPEGEQITGVFPAKMSALRKMMPDPRFVPARLAPGVGAITVTCFEYRQTGIGPYNELAISVPLNSPHFRPNLPGRAMLDGVRRRQFDTWVHHLPVTTEVARLGGVEFYNYPKFIAAIDFEQTDEHRTCRLAEGAEHILTMRAPRIKSRRDEVIQLFSHLYQNREPQTAEFKIHARQLGWSIAPGVAQLELGTRHPISEELARALISTRSISAAYSPNFEGILYGPSHLTPEILDKVIDIESLRSVIA